MFPIKIKRKKKPKKESKPIPQQLKDFILLGFTLELFLFAMVYILVIVFGGSIASAIAAMNIRLTILLYILNLLILPLLLLFYLNHNYSLDEHSLQKRHKMGAALLLLNALYMPYYWYKFVFVRNKKLGKYK